MENLYRKLKQYGESDAYPFHMPGHKRNPLCVSGEFPLGIDITEIDGFDNLHHAVGILKEAQERAAGLFGVKETFFSVNGSTAAILSAISACVKRGGTILTARNCHKAVYHAMYLRNLQPVYVYPYLSTELGLNGAIAPEDVEAALKRHPDAEAVMITSPTYDGIVSDIEKIAQIAHEHGVPLIVDEAHGAHFCFSEYFPVSAAALGADVVIQSVHKTLPAMTQTALLHLCSSRVSRETIGRFMGIYQSSSPSYVLMASIDACVDRLCREGDKMFAVFTDALENARTRLEKCRYIRLITPEIVKAMGGFAYDRSKLVFSTAGSSLTGHEFAELLRRKYHLELEMEAEAYALALTSVGDTAQGFARLCEAVEEIDRQESLKNIKGFWKDRTERARTQNLLSAEMFPQVCMSIAEAMETDWEELPIEKSAGKISAEFVYLYPPGIPLLVPGEEITGHFLENMRRYKEQGLSLQGTKDMACERICTVKE